MKKIVLISLIFGLISIVVFFVQRPDKYLHIIQCDVGQGDGLLVIFGSQQMLIDQGANQKILTCLQNNLPFWDRKLEVVIATHADQDHIGGLADVLTQYHVDHLFMNPTDKQTQTYQKITSIISTSQIERKELYLGDKISLKNGKEDISFQILSPEESLMSECGYVSENTEHEAKPKLSDCPSEYEDENNRSISGKLKFGNFSLLALGDAESSIELAVVDKGLINDIDVLKVSHHGSKFSTSDQFIQKVKPEIALLSVGKNNRFGHPTTRVIDTLRSNNIEIFRTDEVGEIEIVSNGNTYWIEE